MAYSGKLKLAASAVTNPNPNTLSTVSPFPTPFVDQKTSSTAWRTQAASYCNALIPNQANNYGGQTPLLVGFIPSGGALVTYTAYAWTWNHDAGVWMQSANSNCTYQGPMYDRIVEPADSPIFIQLTNISAGTIDIWFDNGLAYLL